MSVAGRAAVGGKDGPWLSILVPAYNVEAYIRECLESAVRQIAGDVEIIVVDDCSTDGTAAILGDIEVAHPGLVHVRRLPLNGGVYRARNLLLDMARGDYIWFLDSDDRVKDGAINKLRQIVTHHAPDFVVCDFSILGAEKGGRWQRRSKSHVVGFRGTPREIVPDRSALIAGMFGAQKMQVWCKVFRRHLLDTSTKLPEGRHFEDIAFSTAVALKASTFYYEPTPWIDYRRTPNSIVSTMTPAKYVELTHALSMAANALRPHMADLSPSAAHAFRYFCVKHFIHALRGLFRYPGSDHTARLLQTCCDNFRRAIAEDDVALAREFARNGRLVAWLKLMAWKARARRVIRRHTGQTPQVPHPDTAG